MLPVVVVRGSRAWEEGGMAGRYGWVMRGCVGECEGLLGFSVRA